MSNGCDSEADVWTVHVTHVPPSNTHTLVGTVTKVKCFFVRSSRSSSTCSSSTCSRRPCPSRECRTGLWEEHSRPPSPPVLKNYPSSTSSLQVPPNCYGIHFTLVTVTPPWISLEIRERSDSFLMSVFFFLLSVLCLAQVWCTTHSCWSTSACAGTHTSTRSTPGASRACGPGCRRRDCSAAVRWERRLLARHRKYSFTVY